MRVCVQTNSKKCTQLHKFPMNPPDNFWVRENDIFPVWKQWKHFYKHICIGTHVFCNTMWIRNMTLRYGVTLDQVWEEETMMLLNQCFLWYGERIETENKHRCGGSSKKRRPDWGPVWSQSMTVSSQLSLGTKQKVHQVQDREEEAEGKGWSSSLLLYRKASWWSVSPRARGGRSI